jgi:lipopolysaccharide biosynthesis glycosyltransferase
MNDDSIHVFASCDERYAPHLCTMFLSLLSNTEVPGRVKLYVADGGISGTTRETLDDVVHGLGAQLVWLFLDNAYDDFPTERWLTRAAYFRLSIPELLSAEIGKVLYLDCDLVVQGDVSDIWKTDIRDHCLGAVENISDRTFRKSGVRQSDYFNSGVMLLNLDQWRKGRVSEQVRAELVGSRAKCTNDQDALNRVLHQRWKRLPLRWNMQSGMYRPHKQLEQYGVGEKVEALFNPAIVHYVGWSKPWTYLSYHPLDDLYWKYRDQTPWRDVGPEQRTLGRRIGRFLSPSLVKKWVRKRLWQQRYRDRGWSFGREHSVRRCVGARDS